MNPPNPKFLPPLVVLLSLAALPGHAATITPVGVDEETNDAWRTSDVAKPFGDADGIYGTDGYFIAQYPNLDPNNTSQPAYGTVATNGQYEGVGAENHQSSFDDVVQAGPGPVADLVAGDYWFEDGAPENAFFTLTLSEPSSFRLGVITDQTPNLDGGPQTLWEASKGVRVTGSGGLDTGIIDVLGPAEAWKDADVDYVLFDITGDAGDEFTVWGVHDDRWMGNALGGVFFDPPSNPDGPEISSFTATPNQIDTPGAEITFEWLVDVPLDSLFLQPGDIDVLGETDPAGEGSFVLNMGPDATTTYQLVATRAGESSQAAAQVVLLAPEIASFKAAPILISPGDFVTLSWEVSLPLTSLTLMPGGIELLPVTDEAGLGTRIVAPGPDTSTTYELVAARGGETTTAEARVVVNVPGTSVTSVGIDETTDDAWRSSDIVKPFDDADNIYGTDGYFIAQLPDGDPGNSLDPPYATVALSGGLMYEGAPNAGAHQAVFDDVLQTGPGDVPDLICGDYWVNAQPNVTGTETEFFTITMTESATFRLGVITDQTPDNPPGLLWEAARSVRITGSNGADTGLVDAVGPAEEWRNADVDYVLFDISGATGDVFTVWGEHDDRWEANALGGVFFDPRDSGLFHITQLSLDSETGFVTFSFTSNSGNFYIVEASTTFEGPWDELDDNVVGMPDTTEYVDDFYAPAAGPRVFYRVRRG